MEIDDTIPLSPEESYLIEMNSKYEKLKINNKRVFKNMEDSLKFFLSMNERFSLIIFKCGTMIISIDQVSNGMVSLKLTQLSQKLVDQKNLGSVCKIDKRGYVITQPECLDDIFDIDYAKSDIFDWFQYHVDLK